MGMRASWRRPANRSSAVGAAPFEAVRRRAVPSPEQARVEAIPADGARWARMLYDFRAQAQGEIDVRAGDLLLVCPPSRSPEGWALVRTADGVSPREGLVPFAFLLVLPPSQQRHAELMALAPMERSQPPTNEAPRRPAVWRTMLASAGQVLLVAAIASAVVFACGHVDGLRAFERMTMTNVHVPGFMSGSMSNPGPTGVAAQAAD